MFRLIYRSVATTDLDSGEIGKIVLHARSRNEREGITGLLLYHNRMIFQILEGDEDKVMTCYERVKGDPRHDQVVVISKREANTRAFTNWFMGYEDVASLPFLARSKVLSFEEIEARLDAVGDIDDVASGKKELMTHLAAYMSRISRDRASA